jgi:integrase
LRCMRTCSGMRSLRAVVESSGVEVAQALLGHRQISTTIDIYAGVDTARLVHAVADAKDLFDLDARRCDRAQGDRSGWPLRVWL